MKAQAGVIRAAVIEHVGMLRSEFGVEIGPCCRLRFEDGSADEITYAALARFVADGAFDLRWEIPKPEGCGC